MWFYRDTIAGKVIRGKSFTTFTNSVIIELLHYCILKSTMHCGITKLCIHYMLCAYGYSYTVTAKLAIQLVCLKNISI